MGHWDLREKKNKTGNTHKVKYAVLSKDLRNPVAIKEIIWGK